MALLIIGLCLWAAIHLLPSAGRGIREAVIARTGFDAYRGLFSVAILGSLALIVFGWRQSTPEYFYVPSETLRSVAIATMAVSFVLLGASGRATRIGRVVRHPQLTGILVWSLAHLMANGDSRSLVLFGGMGIWSVLSMILINRRDGDWIKPEAPSVAKELIGVILSLVVMALVMLAHPWIAAMPLF